MMATVREQDVLKVSFKSPNDRWRQQLINHHALIENDDEVRKFQYWGGRVVFFFDTDYVNCLQMMAKLYVNNWHNLAVIKQIFFWSSTDPMLSPFLQFLHVKGMLIYYIRTEPGEC